MFSKFRFSAILCVAGLLLPPVAAQVQNGDDDEGVSIPQRFQNFGKSLVGGYRGDGRSPNQRPQRSPQQQSQQRRTPPPCTPEYYEDDDSAPRPSNAQMAQRGNSSRDAQPSKRRVVEEPATSHAPPLGAAARKVQPQTAVEAKTPATDSVPRVARAVTATEEDVVPQAVVSAPADATVVHGASSPSISVETVGPRKISVGKQSTYKLVLKNTGAMPAHDVVVTIAVPDFAEVVEAKGTSGSTEPAASQDGMCWKLGTLAAQSKEELSVDIIPQEPAVRIGCPLDPSTCRQSDGGRGPGTETVADPRRGTRGGLRRTLDVQATPVESRHR